MLCLFVISLCPLPAFVFSLLVSFQCHLPYVFTPCLFVSVVCPPVGFLSPRLCLCVSCWTTVVCLSLVLSSSVSAYGICNCQFDHCSLPFHLFLLRSRLCYILGPVQYLHRSPELPVGIYRTGPCLASQSVDGWSGLQDVIGV